MKVKLECSDPVSTETKEYESIESFLKEFPYFSQLLSDGREELETNIRIITEDPLIMNIELYK
jgi:hypothetical protein